ncbi:hypothetical protein H5410_044014 [Solanum commersonii]|uniref:NAC domain-containing protein n=1 Tax=Solanum commersonii TaxID=4109 RepID=A0A9J5Y2H1_SOLCO|nr:hypothetical protein H5410_044014 [Solanum commersonii]
MSKDMNLSVNGESQVPPGFRFHPTEEELVHYYLRKKVAYEKIDLDVIRDVDLNKLEPWDIQEKCRIGSTPQNDWYLFSHKDKKYPTGTRTNRATAAGFWKATGRDKVIHSNCKRIGMRKTLVFYKGRAPHGQKSDWIMHEYRLIDDNIIIPQQTTQLNVSNNLQEEGWVVCRVFKKKNYHTSPLMSTIQKPNYNDGVLDQILMYMHGRSSCKQQDSLENNNNNQLLHLDDMQINNTTNSFTPTFIHLPALHNHHSPTNNINIMDDVQQHCETPKTSRPPVDWSQTSTASGPSDWVSLDRLVASQLNGHDNISSNNNICFPLHHHSHTRPNDDDDAFSQSHQPHDDHQVDVEFWSYAPSPSDPLCHLLV